MPHVYQCSLQQLAACLAVLSMAHTSLGQDEDLLKYLPRSANALVVIDVESLLKSEVAAKEGWKKKGTMQYGQRPLQIPPEAKVVVVAAQLDSSERLSRNWELAVVRLSETFPLNAIARTEGGYVDQIAETAAVWTPSNAYVVSLADDVLGMIYPADRQFVSRWVKLSEKNRLVELSDYLYRASAGVNADSQIVMALDLVDVVQPHRVREALSQSEILNADAAKVEEFTSLVSSIQGVTLTIQVADDMNGTIRVDFASDVAPLGRLAKPLLLEALDRYGADLPDLASWSAELLGRTLVFKGKLSDSGLRRIGSLLEMPSTKFSDLKVAEPVEPGSDTYTEASQAYFRSVTALIADLRQETTGGGQSHGVWFERYGRKIDSLPILNVDSELLDWGATVASTFRNMSVVDRSANVRAGVRKSQVYTGYSYGYYNNATGTALQQSTIQREERGKAMTSRFTSWKEVEDATADVRRRMTETYNVEF